MTATVMLKRVVLGVAFSSAVAAAASAQDLLKDESLGFQLRAPRGWERVPIRDDENWIVGKYRSPKAETSVDPTSGYTLEMFPELMVIAIRRDVEDGEDGADGADGEEGEDGGDGEDGEDALVGKTYRNYPEYLKDNYPHGHFIEKEEAANHAGLNVTRFEIKAERDLNFAERRIVTWVYETELADVAVQIEVTSEGFKKLQSAIKDAHQSFKVIPRTKELSAHKNPFAGFLSSIELAKLTPAERKERKLALQQQSWERVTSNLPSGWTASVIDGVHVVNHVDDRFAKKVAEQIVAIYGWLETTFPEVGAFEHARLPMVRICKDQDEEDSFRSGSGTYGVSGLDLVTHKGSRSESWEWEYIGGRTLQIWFEERDIELWYSMPAWLRIGLDEVVGAAQLEAGKLSFGVGDLERAVRETLPRGDDEGLDVHALMLLSKGELYEAMGEGKDNRPWCQSVGLTRYFVGARSKKTRELLASYMSNLRVVLSDFEAEDEKNDTDSKEPTNEEEEEALFKKRQEQMKERERAILERTLELTFPGWKAGDWKGLDKEFRRSL